MKRLKLFAILLFAFLPCHAQVDLVAQPNEGEELIGTVYPWFYEFNGTAYFRYTDNISNGLFYTDGSQEGTHCLTRDFEPEYITSYGEYMYVMGKKAQYNYSWGNPFNGYAIWRISINHTEIKKLVDINRPYGIWGFEMWAVDGKIFFSKNGGLDYYDVELEKTVYVLDGWSNPAGEGDSGWIYDHTENSEGMYLIGENSLGRNLFYYDYNIDHMTPLIDNWNNSPPGDNNKFLMVEDTCFLVHMDDTLKLYKSLGSKENTELVWSCYPGIYNNHWVKNSSIVWWDGCLVFNISEIINEVWFHSVYCLKNDKVELLGRFTYGSLSDCMRITNEGILVSLIKQGEKDILELWLFDGQEFFLKEELEIPGIDFNANHFEYVGDKYLVSGNRLGIYNPQTYEWELISGYCTNKVWNIKENYFTFIDNGNTSLDPLVLQTKPIYLDTIIMPEKKRYSTIRELTPGGDKLYFVADSEQYGYELWVTDPNGKGTYLVKDIDTSGGSFPRALVIFNNKLIFSAYGGSSGLWRSDGSESETQMISDIDIWENLRKREKVIYKNSLYFVGSPKGSYPAPRNIYRLDYNDSIRPLYDGSEGVEIKQVFNLTSCGDHLFFMGIDGENNNDLWISDGSITGTYSLDKMGNDGTYSSWTGEEVFESGEFLYYTMRSTFNDIDQKNVCITDGTEQGTRRLNLPDGDLLKNTNIDFLGGENGELFFTYSSPSHGLELWYADGLNGNVIQLTGLSDTDRQADKKFSEGRYLGEQFFFICYTPELSTELWVTDKTLEGTHCFFELKSGSEGTYPKELVSYRGKLLFFVDGEDIDQPLWITDGTFEGTEPMSWDYPRLVDFSQGLIWNEDFYFVASHPESGQALFKYDLEGLTGIREISIGAKDFVDNNIVLYPNPVADQLHISYSGNAEKSYLGEILDINGARIQFVKIRNGEGQFNSASLPKGFYFIRIGEEISNFVKE